MVRIDGNGRDGGGRREYIPLTYSPSFHFYFSLFLSFSPSFFLAYFFSFFSLFLFNFFSFQRYFKISKEFSQNKDMEELFHGVLKRVCQI